MVPHPYTQVNAQNFIKSCMCNAGADSYELAIELKAEKKVIGGTSINAINKQHGTARGGIWLNVNYHGIEGRVYNGSIG